MSEPETPFNVCLSAIMRVLCSAANTASFLDRIAPTKASLLCYRQPKNTKASRQDKTHLAFPNATGINHHPIRANAMYPWVDRWLFNFVDSSCDMVDHDHRMVQDSKTFH